MKQKKIKAGNNNLAYYESQGTGPSVLFIHGNSSSGLTFQKQLESELGQKYRLIALDLPGHGKSDPAPDPESTYSLPGYASVIADVTNKLSLDNAVFVGWSLGGHILLEAAGQISNARGLMIFGTPPIGIPPAIEEAFLPCSTMQFIFKDKLTEEDIELWANSLYKDDPKPFEADIRLSDGRARAEMGKSIGQCKYMDEVEIVKNMNIPLAVLHGETDPVINLKYIKNLKVPALWRNEVQVIQDTGHAPHWEQEEPFNSLLENFIEET